MILPQRFSPAWIPLRPDENSSILWFCNLLDAQAPNTQVNVRICFRNGSVTVTEACLACLRLSKFVPHTVTEQAKETRSAWKKTKHPIFASFPEYPKRGGQGTGGRVLVPRTQVKKSCVAVGGGDTGCNDKIKQRQNKLQQVRFVSWPDLWNARKYLVGGATAEICPGLWGLRTQSPESLLCPENWDSWSLTIVLVWPSIFFLSLRGR